MIFFHAPYKDKKPQKCTNYPVTERINKQRNVTSSIAFSITMLTFFCFYLGNLNEAKDGISGCCLMSLIHAFSVLLDTAAFPVEKLWVTATSLELKVIAERLAQGEV